MAKNLVIVESPAKAKTISKILGKDYKVVSSMGHLIDLPKTKLGVDLENNFEPTYVLIKGRKKIADELKKEASKKEMVYVATDPDREGEAIGWHIKNSFLKENNVSRVTFHEITKAAVENAFFNLRDFDANMVEAQASRRILDRLVGYFLSPLLWKKIGRGLSAGRVQSVALRIIVEREREIAKFIPNEYWEIEASFKQGKDKFCAKLSKIDNEKAQITTRTQAEKIVEELIPKDFIVSDVIIKEKKRNPLPPFITSTLQQEGFNKLKYSARKTMMIAQQLYEGIDIGEEGPVGLITYMRTDSVHVADEAIKEVREHILKNYSKEYLPDTPNQYKTKKSAQAAHEAIRPTMIARTPESIKNFLEPEQLKVYEIIYQRFIASQMTPARYSSTSVEISADKYLFSASGSKLIFEGFLSMYQDKIEKEEEKESVLPVLEKGQRLNLLEINPSQHFTKPPARYSDASLVKILEEEGIGRPSTYAPIIYTLIQRDYVRRLKGYLQASELGFKVCDMLVEYFPKIVDVKFTARMEEELDEIEEGNFDRKKILDEFYVPFKESLDFAQENIKKEIIETGEACAACGKPMIVKWGRRGKFLSCSGFPDCKVSKSISSGVKCPQEACGGELIERRSYRGFFYGCSNFPKCRFTSKTLPQEEPQGK